MAKPRDVRTIRRGCNDKTVATALVRALKSGIRYRMTKSGVMLYGNNGRTANVHFTNSDHRSVKNLQRELRMLGLNRKEH